jgi:hypothetical protein
LRHRLAVHKAGVPVFGLEGVTCDGGDAVADAAKFDLMRQIKRRY